MLDRCRAEEERSKSLDGKITALIAGVAAFIGFSSRFPPSIRSTSAVLLYLAPLAVLFSAFMSDRIARGPTPEALETFFPSYPVRTLRDAIRGMTKIRAMNACTNERKANRLDVAVVLTACITAVVMVMQAVVALH